MKACPACMRHVRHRDAVCPFCDARLRETSAWSAVVGLVVATGCGPAVDPGGDAEGATTTTDSGPMDSLTTTPMSSSSSSMTTASTTVNPSTTGMDDGTTDGSATEDPSSAGFIYGSATDGITDPCDVWAQDCPEGETCVPWANDGGNQWNDTLCRGVPDDPSAVGEPCAVEGSAVSGFDDCEAGSMCFFVDPDTLEGTCVALCTGSENDPVCDDAETICAMTHEGVINLCLPACDPLGDDCGELQGCWSDGDDFFCFPDHSGDTGTYGDGCAYLNECDAGFFCAGATHVPGCADEGCCSTYCNLADVDPDATCPGYDDGQRCLPWFQGDPGPPDHDDVGGCAVPP